MHRIKNHIRDKTPDVKERNINACVDVMFLQVSIAKKCLPVTSVPIVQITKGRGHIATNNLFAKPVTKIVVNPQSEFE